MPRKADDRTWRVVVYIREPLAWEGDAMARAKLVEKQINRHIDHVENTSLDVDSICEYCLSKWSEESPVYNGGCCDKDEEHAKMVSKKN